MTNRTHAFVALAKNTLFNESTGLPRSPTLPSVDSSNPFEERDQAWLFSMVQKQFEIDPDWFAVQTLYPINSTGVNSTLGLAKTTGVQSINKYWYFTG